MHTQKSTGRRILECLRNRYRINDTAIYKQYLRWRHPAHYDTLKQRVEFYRDLVREAGGGLVIDVGANVGNKAAIFSQVADQVVCVEPAPGAAQILRERFAGSSIVTVVQAGLGAEPGSHPFYEFDEADGHNTFSAKWADTLRTSSGSEGPPSKRTQSIAELPMNTLDALIDQHGVPAFIKIDVEGFEIEVLRGLSHRVKLVSFECNLPVFRDESLECLTRLDELQADAQFNYDCTPKPPEQFASQRWLSRSEMADVIHRGQHHFLEIYAMDR